MSVCTVRLGLLHSSHAVRKDSSPRSEPEAKSGFESSGTPSYDRSLFRGARHPGSSTAWEGDNKHLLITLHILQGPFVKAIRVSQLGEAREANKPQASAGR